MKKKILVLQPNYVKRFKCTGNDCEYHCCHGWKIDIDKKTFKNYRKISNTQAIKKVINKNVIINKDGIGNDQYAKIILDNNKICPFLDKDGLCTIHMEYGENYLSKTCNQYPRIINIVDNMIEKSCHISCPEVTKLLFNEQAISFDQFEDEIDIDTYSVCMKLDTNCKNEINKNFWKLREVSIDMLQNKNFKLHERIFILGLILDKVQKAIDNGESTKINSIVDESLKKYCNQYIKEYIDNIKFKYTVKFDLINSICNTKIKDKNVLEDYNNLFLKFLEGIDYDEKNPEYIIKSYKTGYEDIYKPFFDDKEYILENYFVNDVFLNLFPVRSGDKIFEEYCILVIKFAVMKIFLVGIGKYYKCLDDDKVMKILYLYSRNIEHTKGYIDSILEAIKEDNNLNMAFLSLLIKN
ncbi:flagellin lysine-N-methylase [Clostridium uliginosum]|uniref:Lysine-N-methylase n=1 Tax=Clostridium uliginosum TaxID=119641 RepID=A0A1I1KIR7_9CLOT|nr:flagellin lysine-N-methylase [Clostridium uliginosum]SFC60766.1 lysine-N-methylase [Clostridium uliginosum]